MSNLLVNMAREILAIEADFPYRLDYSEDKRISVNDFTLHNFTQTWGSTALGFGGIGGQALTQATTYVFIPETCNHKCLVYFGGRFAYKADYCEALVEDIRKGHLEPVSRSYKYTNNSIETDNFILGKNN